MSTQMATTATTRQGQVVADPRMNYTVTAPSSGVRYSVTPHEPTPRDKK